MRIAVVGGGLFGSTAAIHAARAGHEVHLYEVKRDLMLGATAGTYSRLHRGFHYPRSPATGRESRAAEASFRKEYGAAVIDSGHQFYIVPPDRNHVSVEQYKWFLDTYDLPFSEEGGVFSVAEPRIDLAKLQALVRQKVYEAGVQLHLGSPLPPDARRRYDHIVVATYSGLNDSLMALGYEPEVYKFQVVERPQVLLPKGFRDTSIVVIDGPFGCLDPLDDSPHHVLGHVVHTVHAANTGHRPNIPGHLLPLIDRGLVRNSCVTHIDKVVEDLARYIPGVREAVYVGSSFVVRAVLANQEATDARPTLVKRIGPQVVMIFSGKLGTAVRAAQDVLGLIEEKVDAEEMVAA
jgi:hypothetical protein